MRYREGDIVEVINSVKYPTMREVHAAGGECSFWLANGMAPPIIGARFRVIEEKGDKVWVYAGGKDRTGFHLCHALDPQSVMLYRR